MSPYYEGGFHTILLTEGRGIKPWVTAQRNRLPVVGCGGSPYGAGSPEQLLRYCGQLCSGGRLIIYADAGWLLNTGVAQSWAHTVAVLEKAGFNPLIAAANPWEKESKGRKKSYPLPDGDFAEGSDPQGGTSSKDLLAAQLGIWTFGIIAL